MANFYFTYGREGHPYYGGWTVIEAPNDRIAVAAFRAYHPDRHCGLLNCFRVYDEMSFAATGMQVRGNLGQCCHEVITIRRELAAKI